METQELFNQGYSLRKNISLEEWERISDGIGEVINKTDVVLVPGSSKAFHSSNEMSLHTDHPTANLISWFCVSQADEGGTSILIDTRNILMMLSQENLKILSNIRINVPNIKGVQLVHSEPLLNGHSVYFADWLIPDSLREFEKRAIDNFIECIKISDKICINMHPNDALFIDNKRMLHGRSSFLEKAHKRFLLRKWIKCGLDKKTG